MGAVMPVILLLLKLCISIVFALVVQGSAGYNIFPPPENFPAISPVVEETPDPVHHRKSLRSIAPSPASLPYGSFLSSPLVLPPLMSAPVPQMIKEHVPFLSPSTPTIPAYGTAPPPSAFEGHVPSSPPSTPQRKAAPAKTTPASVPLAPVPVATPWRYAPVNKAPMPELKTFPPSAHQGNAPSSKVLKQEPIAPVSVASPSRQSGQSPPAAHPAMPNMRGSKLPVPVASPASEMPQNPPAIHPGMPGESPSILPDPNTSPTSNPSPSIIWKRDGMPVAAPPYGMPMPIPPMYHSTDKGPISAVAPSKHKITRHSNGPIAPFLSSPKSPNKGYHSPASSPSASFHKHPRIRNKIPSPPPASSYPVSPPASKQGPAVPAELLPKNRQRHYAPPPLNPGSLFSPSHFPFPPPVSHVSQAPSPSPIAASAHTIISPLGSSSTSPKLPLPPLVQALPPPPPNEVSPLGSSSKSPKLPLPPLVQALPPPPPNEDCSSTICTEPYTNTPPGSPCGCVWPMQVGLRLSISLYTFFPLVSELAQEIAAGVFMKQSQVRIIGANAATQQPEKTIVLIDLVPLGETFDNTTAFLTYQRFWHKQVAIKAPFFGDYDVLYVHYQGLPPSPPLAPSSITIIDDGPYSGNDTNARTRKPLGVDVGKRQHNHGLNNSVIAIIALSAFVTVVLCSAASWVFLFRRREHVRQTEPTVQALLPSLAKPSGNAGSLIGSGPSSASLSFGSSIATFTGSAKTFSTSDIERATDKFDASRILGEGGFGRVYSGVLEDGTKVAVKVLKRADQHSGREFLAEVEMLSRLHHRNLVKLIGICTEECARCLVYELIPNGSVESHLHGVEKESTPLDWGARIKIALGAARALAYLHEDSSPRVIHRDFKSSNILLEHDFTPKVSDFGLARTAMDDENRHISTRVMGTFGYVAPEYAMTGHLLVKSDVYSYGVVLLELLTGRKPVDMSLLPGQENLVAWARPLLTSKEGLETIIDTSLGPDVPFDSVAKVAAIASMCVQAEVSHRPFMGEVVQALKLVCNECDEAKGTVSRNTSREDLSIDMDRISTASGQLPDTLQGQYSVPNYNTGPDTARGLSASELFSSSARFGRQDSGSFRMLSSSGPLRTGRGRQFWQRMRRLSGGSVSEHGVMFKLWPGSH